ncbi:ComF family protein [Flavobacterium sp.]|uniref:ComF family protein n=1 Tax=Flavobacterium sp. TaxID=239 RepID=UPI0028BEAC3C|nr:ComF family protein [Flavobacterium sp.]
MNALKNLLNLLFPNLCNGCKTLLLSNEKTICLRCRHELPYTNHLQQPDNETFKKFYGKLPVEHASSIVYFQKEGITQQLIHNLKYKGTEEVGHFFGALYAENINQNHILKTVDYIIPVPLHPKKLRERGYNQVTTFGKALAANSGKNYLENILFRTQYSKTQTQKNIIGRAEATKDIFDVKFSETDYGKHFLLIDDVITTGATLQDCGRALLKIPGAKISVLTIAYAQS